MGGEGAEALEEEGRGEGEGGTPRDIEEHGVGVVYGQPRRFAPVSWGRTFLIIYLFISFSRCHPHFEVVDRTVVLWNRR